jgi:tetrahydromethanopterin S-methyltransferase subunit E
MIKISTIFALGIFIALLPFTGFSNDSAFPVKNILYIVSGLLVTILSILIRKELEEVIRHSYTDIVKTDTFSENNPKQQEKIEE